MRPGLTGRFAPVEASSLERVVAALAPDVAPARERGMLRKLFYATAVVGLVLASGQPGDAKAKTKAVRVVAVEPAEPALPVQNCSVFYPTYLGFGSMAGALPRSARTEFPDWHGECLNWGIYSASGTAIISW